MLIGIDVDDVLAAFNVALQEFHNRQWGTQLTLEDITTHGLWNVWRCTKDESIRRVSDFYRSPGFLAIQPIDGAIEGVRRLRKRHDLVVVSSRPPWLLDSTKLWIERFFGGQFSNVHLTGGYANPDTESKATYCLRCGIRPLIEDAPHYVDECVAVGIPVVLFDRPWNRQYEKDGVVRMVSWQDASKLVECASAVTPAP